MSAIKSLKRLEETTLRLGGNGDNWHMSWASDDKQYVSLCDGRGFAGLPSQDYNSRTYAITDDPPNVRFEFLPGYPDLINVDGTSDINRYYNFGILALDGALYQFLSTPNRAFNLLSPRFAGVKLIYSPDNGRSWRNQTGQAAVRPEGAAVRWEPWAERNRENMLFFNEPGEAFSLITVLQMGRNYSANRDGFVYLYAPNGNIEGTMNQMVLARVPKGQILDRGAYTFFAGQHGSSISWSPHIGERAVVHTFPAGWVNRFVHPYAWHPSVVYYPATSQYLMANWGMGCAIDGMWFGKPSYLGFWTAPQPWGPWTQVYGDDRWTPVGDAAARCYQPQIAPKWIAADGRSFWLVWTDFQVIDAVRPFYAFNLQKVEVTLAA